MIDAGMANTQGKVQASDEMTDERDGGGFSASEYSFFVDRDVVLLAIRNICDDGMEKDWEKHWAIYSTALSKYQEQPLLLNPSLEELMRPLCDRLLHLSSFLVDEYSDEGGSPGHPSYQMKVSLLDVYLFFSSNFLLSLPFCCFSLYVYCLSITSSTSKMNEYLTMHPLLPPKPNKNIDRLSQSEGLFFVCRCIQLLSRVRGYKHILRFFPHEVSHLEMNMSLLKCQVWHQSMHMKIHEFHHFVPSTHLSFV